MDRNADTGRDYWQPAGRRYGPNGPTYPPASPEFSLQGLEYSVDLLNSYGITAITDASVQPHDLEAYRALDRRGELSLRVVASLWWERTLGLEQIETFKQQRQDYTEGTWSPVL